MKFKNELEIDVGRCLHAIFKKKKFIILIAVLFFVAGFAYTFEEGDDLYTATSTVYAAASGNYSESSTAVTAMNSYMDVASSYKVCQRAALLLGRTDVDAADIMADVSASSSVDLTSTTSVSSLLASSATTITFSATTNDPELSMEMADAAADAYVIEMESILNNDSVKSLDSAYSYVKSRNAKVTAWKKRLLALIAGAVIGALVVVFFEIFDKKVRTIREASIRNELPIIGVIPDYKE